MKELTVIVTACGAPGGPGIIKALRQVKERKITIIGTDANPLASGFLLSDKAYVVPNGESKSYIPAMLKLVKKTKADVILPLSSMELMALSTKKAVFEDTRVVVNEKRPLEIALNKKKCYEFLKGKHVPIPDYSAVHSYDELKEAAQTLGYPKKPVCFKPPVSKGQRGFRILREDVDLTKLLLETKPDSTVATLDMVSSLSKGFKELLVMEYLPGPEYSIDSLVKNGESLVAVPRKRVETKLGISSVGVVEKNEEIMEVARRINKLFKFDYNINVQLKYSTNDTPKLVEINPRVSGTICLSAAAGPNLPYLAIKMCLGEQFTIPRINWGLTMIRYLDELYSKKYPSFPKLKG